jgi:hypothetical protein
MSNFKGKIIPFLGFVLGIFFIVAYFLGDHFLSKTPRKSDLTMVSGEVEWAARASKAGRDVRFKLKDQGTYVYNGYGGTLAKEIYESLTRNGVKVHVLADLSEIQSPWFHELSYNPVYEIKVNGAVIRSYEEAAESIERGAFILPWFGLFLILTSAYEYRKYRNQFKT